MAPQKLSPRCDTLALDAEEGTPKPYLHTPQCNAWPAMRCFLCPLGGIPNMEVVMRFLFSLGDLALASAIDSWIAATAEA